MLLPLTQLKGDELTETMWRFYREWARFARTREAFYKTLTGLLTASAELGESQSRFLASMYKEAKLDTEFEKSFYNETIKKLKSQIMDELIRDVTSALEQAAAKSVPQSLEYARRTAMLIEIMPEKMDEILCNIDPATVKRFPGNNRQWMNICRLLKRR